jgi:hypothetical protein
MNDLKKSKNYAVAKGPVNRRTAAAAPVAKPVAAQVVLQRISMAHAKRRLGSPLSQRVAASTQAVAAGALPGTAAIAQAVVGTTCAIGLGLGVIQSSVWLMGASATALGCVALWAAISRKVHPVRRGASRVVGADVADAQALVQLDAVMEKMAAQAPQATLDSLVQLKESIVRCTALLSEGGGEAGLAGEESLYLREAVRRYIPDSINSCLKVPLKDRASLVIDDSKPALDLLQDQLQMIQQQLDVREAKLAQFAGEALLRQQLFLASKANGG